MRIMHILIVVYVNMLTFIVNVVTLESGIKVPLCCIYQTRVLDKLF